MVAGMQVLLLFRDPMRTFIIVAAVVASSCLGTTEPFRNGGTTEVDAGSGLLDTADAGPCTPLSGTVTTLTRGHYCVTGDVIIPTGVTLEIPAGTVFTVMGRYHFGRDPSWPDGEPPAGQGSGSIHAIGTAAEPILFRGVTPSVGWFGLVVSHSHDTVHLEYVTIRDTYKDDTNPSSRIWKRGGALGSYVNVRGTIIRHCSFLNNRARSVAGAIDLNSHGSWPNAGPVEITDSLFEDNSCECQVYSGSSTDLCGGGAIRFSHVGGDATLVKIERNVFENNHAATDDGAISCNGQDRLGTIIDEVDPSVVFSGNTPDDGCGQ